MRTPIHRRLYLQVLAAVAAGVVLGALRPELATEAKPLGDGFIRLIRMVIAPVIFCTVVSGIAGMRDARKVGRVGGKALLYFEAVSTVALLLGLVVANVARPGAGFDIDVSTLDARAVAQFAARAGDAQGVAAFLLAAIPDTIVGAFARGDVLQVLLVSVLFGFALAAMGERARPLVDLIDAAAQAVFGVIGIVMKAAPLGAFGAMAFTVGRYGVESLLPLARLMGVFYLTALLFVFGVLGAIAHATGFSISRLLVYLREELLIVLGTSSSESALPALMRKLEAMGCSRPVVGLVVPTGYSFNLDGTNLYMTMAALFVAQATNTELTLSQQLTLLAVAMLTSKGASGVAGAGFVTLAATLAVVPGVPLAGMALILGVDNFMSQCRALTNFVGNGVAAVVVSRWEGELDAARMEAVLGGSPASPRLPRPSVA